MELIEIKLFSYIQEKYKKKSNHMGRRSKPLPENFNQCLLKWYESTAIKPYTLDMFASDVGIKKFTLVDIIKRHEKLLLEKYSFEKELKNN